jgi:hypothetical protein
MLSQSCDEYAKKTIFSSQMVGNSFDVVAKSEKKLQQMINQLKLKSYQHDPFWKFGV